MAEVLQSEDTVLIKNSDDEFADDEQNVKKMTASEALNSLGVVKCFAEIHERNAKWINTKSRNSQVAKC